MAATIEVLASFADCSACDPVDCRLPFLTTLPGTTFVDSRGLRQKGEAEMKTKFRQVKSGPQGSGTLLGEDTRLAYLLLSFR